MENAEEIRGAVGHALSDAVRGEGEMVTNWVALIEVMDGNGKRACYTLAAPDAMSWDILGLLIYGTQIEKAALASEAD